MLGKSLPEVNLYFVLAPAGTYRYFRKIEGSHGCCFCSHCQVSGQITSRSHTCHSIYFDDRLFQISVHDLLRILVHKAVLLLNFIPIGGQLAGQIGGY